MAAENETIDLELNVEVAKAQSDVTKLRNEIDNLTDARDKAKNMSREQHTAADKLAVAQAKLAVSEKKLTTLKRESASAEAGSTRAIMNQIKALQLENQQLSKTSAQYAINTRKINDFSKQINVSSAASGAATSSVMELGRVISDAPYGMRGMANNLSQLTSMMFYASTAAGGLSLALKQMWKAMMGPLGLVLAITAVISTLDYLSTKVDKTKKALDSLTQVFGEETSKLLVLKSALDSSNISLEEKTRLVTLAKEEFHDLNIELDEQGILTTASTNALMLYTQQLVKTAKAKAILELITKEQLKMAEEEGKSTIDTIAWYERLWLGFINIGDKSQKQIAANMMLDMSKENRDEKTKEYKDATKKYMDMLMADNGELALLLWNPKKSKEGPKDPKRKDPNAFEGKIIDYTKENNKIRDKMMMDTIIFEADKLAYLQDSAIRDLEQSKANWNIKEDAAHNNYVRKMEKMRDADGQSQENQDIANAAIIKSNEEYLDKLIDNEQAFLDAMALLKEGQLLETNIFNQNQFEEELDFQEKMNEFEKSNRELKQTFRGLVRVADRDADRLEIEEKIASNKVKLDTEKLSLQDQYALKLENAKLIKKLNDDQITDDARVYAAKKQMMNQVMDSVASVFSTMKSNAEKGSKEEKKYAMLEIYAGAAKGLMNGVLIAGEAATAGGPAAPFIYAGVLATQVASIYGAVSQAKAVLNGANPSGGTKSATPTFSPNFNVVGNSNENQLAEGIGNQVNSPTRAYVVYEDIAEAGETSAQSIESSGI
jgi:hypothetical protein